MMVKGPWSRVFQKLSSYREVILEKIPEKAEELIRIEEKE